jgi:uncharacterized membrane protein YvlD (DUF360 family)
MLYPTDWIVRDSEIRTFWWRVLGALIVSLVDWIAGAFLPDLNPPREGRVTY